MLIALMQHLDGACFQSFWLACDACRSVNLSKGSNHTPTFPVKILCQIGRVPRICQQLFEKCVGSLIANSICMLRAISFYV